MPQLTNISLAYGDLKIFENFNISFKKNAINCILGPSGCGKTTLLNILAGIIKPGNGLISGIDTNKISVVFQEPRLLLWKTARKNIEFTLKDKIPDHLIGEVTEKYLKLVGLDNFMDYYPSRLSGGMKQRVSLARAFSFPSAIILMDEPFKGLDYKLKRELQNSFYELWKIDKRTVIFVTHDVDEALELGDSIYIFSNAPVKILKTFQKDSNIPGNIERNEIIALMENGY